jgi:hypothetical protein
MDKTHNSHNILLHLYYPFGISCHKHNLKSVHADYIYHKNDKGKSCEKDLPELKNDITKFLVP